MKNILTSKGLIGFLAALMLAANLLAGPSQVFYNVMDHGAQADGEFKNTEVIAKMIDKLAAEGGGTIYFPAGEYLTGPIHFKNNITLYIDAGAVLKFSDDFDDYLPMVKSRWEGTVSMNFSPLIYGYQVENVAIQGRGTIDGNGQKWWDFYGNLRQENKKFGEVRTQSKWQKLHREMNKETLQPNTWMWDNNNFLRPALVQFFDSKNILIEDVTLINSPFWTVNPELCDNLTITGITIKNPPESYNTDGINPSSCTNVHISNCHISVGDDCITLKSGRDEDGRRVARPAENITITNCTMLNGHGGVVIGSEMSGDVRKVTISNCVFDGTDRGIRLKSMRGRGGVVEEIRVSNIVMKNIILEAFMMNMYYQESPIEPVSERTPKFRNIHLSNVTVSESNQAGKLIGLDEMHMENITFTNINMEAKQGFDIKNVKNIKFQDVVVNTEQGPALTAENISNLEISGFGTLQPHQDAPVVLLKNVIDSWIHNAYPVKGTKNYLKVQGENAKGIVVSNNNFIHTEEPVVKNKSAPNDGVIVDK